jgi:hypothetical protein
LSLALTLSIHNKQVIVDSQKHGNTEFRIQTTNNPAQRGHPTYCSDTQPPPCVMTTGAWNGTVGPNFSHSGVQESLLTQVHRKPRLITVLSLGGQMWLVLSFNNKSKLDFI